MESKPSQAVEDRLPLSCAAPDLLTPEAVAFVQDLALPIPPQPPGASWPSAGSARPVRPGRAPRLPAGDRAIRQGAWTVAALPGSRSWTGGWRSPARPSGRCSSTP